MALRSRSFGLATRFLPAALVLAAVIENRFDGLTDDLARLARQIPLALAGAGATQAIADETGARLLTGDPVTEAQRLLPPARRR